MGIHVLLRHRKKIDKNIKKIQKILLHFSEERDIIRSYPKNAKVANAVYQMFATSMHWRHFAGLIHDNNKKAVYRLTIDSLSCWYIKQKRKQTIGGI